ncbi:MAG: LPS export ABC transporter permease LptF [Acetobacteraceae bacterium]|nr:LPS export ABC transporter permease LptF [Acetobacteraceae bacterium]
MAGTFRSRLLSALPRRAPTTRIDRYVFRQLLLALIATTGGLAALIWLTQSLRFVELVVNRGLSLGVFLELTGLLIPSFVAVILPITTFVVVQFVYQRLQGDRELTVMRAAGLSPLGLARPGLAAAALAIGFGYLLNLWIVPSSLTAFREFQWEIRNRMVAFLLQEGVFTAVSDDLTVYVRSRDPEGTLHGILVDDARQKNSHATILAERGQLVEGASGPRVLLINGSRQEIDRQTGRLNVLTFGENTIDLAQSAKNEAGRVRDMSEVSVHELLHPTPDVLALARDAPKWYAEAHKRLATPLTAGSFAMVALLAVLEGTFRRYGGLVRPLVAIGTIVALLASGLAIGNLAARDNSLVPLIWLHAIGPGLVCGWLLFRPRGWALRRPAPSHA